MDGLYIFQNECTLFFQFYVISFVCIWKSLLLIFRFQQLPQNLISSKLFINLEMFHWCKKNWMRFIFFFFNLYYTSIFFLFQLSDWKATISQDHITPKELTIDWSSFEVNSEASPNSISTNQPEPVIDWSSFEVSSDSNQTSNTGINWDFTIEKEGELNVSNEISSLTSSANYTLDDLDNRKYFISALAEVSSTLLFFCLILFNVI